MECHQQRDPEVPGALTHAVPNGNPTGGAVCGVVISVEFSQAMWRAIGYAKPWSDPTPTERCPACLAAVPLS